MPVPGTRLTDITTETHSGRAAAPPTITFHQHLRSSLATTSPTTVTTSSPVISHAFAHLTTGTPHNIAATSSWLSGMREYVITPGARPIAALLYARRTKCL